MPETIIVVPCFNEAARLAPAEFRSFAERWRHGSFLFVDDGSTDGTFSILSALKGSMPARAEILRLPRNAGKAEAVRHGFLEAFRSSPEYVGFWDSDLATPLDAIPLLEAVLRDRPQTEVVLGARVKLLGRDVRRKRTRHYAGRAFATAVSLLTGIEIYDSQCGAKLFRSTDTVRAIFATRFLARWVFDVEILVRFMRLKRAEARLGADAFLYELPLPVWHDVAGSKLRPRDFARALVDLIRISCSR